MGWQEAAVVLIVGWAVVSLVRHIRGLIGSASPDAAAGCHGCDECETDGPPLATPARATAPLPTERTRVH